MLILLNYEIPVQLSLDFQAQPDAVLTSQKGFLVKIQATDSCSWLRYLCSCSKWRNFQWRFNLQWNLQQFSALCTRHCLCSGDPSAGDTSGDTSCTGDTSGTSDASCTGGTSNDLQWHRSNCTETGDDDQLQGCIDAWNQLDMLGFIAMAT